ncbi:MAG: isocitrate lyase/PEP mutase family protein [Clostridia bacterium]|nr:isocitrate lyase/PEP mutase family protein [Clostridia bacterium]
MSETKTTLELLAEKEQLFVPCIWDCMSAKAVELTGFKAMLLSSAAVSYSLLGMPDIGLISMTEMVEVCGHIADYSKVPIIVDGDEGFGDSPINVYRTCKMFAKAGAKAITIDDQCGIRGFERSITFGPDACPVVSREAYLAKIKAAVEALKGTDCTLIARTAAKTRLGFDEAITRTRLAVELGAQMSMILGLHSLEECQKVAENVPGIKMYPDVVSRNGVPDVELDDIDKLGFKLVSMHYLEKGAMWGMLDFGKKNIEAKNTVYSDEHDMGGVDIWNACTFNHKEWFALEDKCNETGRAYSTEK